jgi:two-component system sensor histidine kinase UhpB
MSANAIERSDRWDGGTSGFRRVIRWLVVYALFAAATTALAPGLIGLWHWNLSAGLVFGALLVAPRWARSALILSAMRVDLIVVGLWTLWSDPVAVSGGVQGFAFEVLVVDILDPLATLFVVSILRRHLVSPSDLCGLRGSTLLHCAAFAAAVPMTITDVLWVIDEGFVADLRQGEVLDAIRITAGNAWVLIGTFAVKNLLGYFLGIMLMAPLLGWLVERELRRGSAPILRDTLVFLLPSVVLFVAIVLSIAGTKLAELLRLLLLAAMVVFAMRHGWRGAALSVLTVSAALGVEDHLGKTTMSPVVLQAFVAIAGAMALLFGATVDALRAQAGALDRARLAERHAREELAEAAGRVVRAQEVERRRFAADLHDEVGQNLAALQTQIKLAESDLTTTPQRDFLDALRHLGVDMRRALRDVLEAIHPAALSELGLVRTLEHGVLRKRAEGANVRFDVRARGASSLYEALDDAVRVSAYRIVQEALNNVLRHAGARRVVVSLRVRWRMGELQLMLRVSDDGRGVRENAEPGIGLRGMRDRALMLGGELKVARNRGAGTVVKALLRQRAR